tara:strand:+ start:50 stop:1378 length:1329 start_codon:yes stop_codon:yes gene_type:complete
MAKFSQTFLQGLLQPTYQQGLFDVARSVGQAPALMRQQEQRQQREKGRMGGMLAAQQAASEGRFDPETMKSYIGSMQGLGVSSADIMQTLPTLQQANQASVVNNKQNQLVGLQQQLNEQAQILLQSDDQSRKEAANYQIDSIEEQMVNIGKETRGIDAGTFVGVGDKTRAGVTKAQLNQIEIDAKKRAAQEQLAISTLEQLDFGSEEWNAQAAKLEKAGYRKAVQAVRKKEQDIAIATQEFKDAMQANKVPTPAQIKEMKDKNIPVPEDALGQKQAWKAYLKEKQAKAIAAATASLDPVSAARAEGLVKWTMQGISERGDFIDVFSDDITSVIEELTPEQHSEINSLVTGKAESDVGPIVEQWLRRNYPEPFEKSEQFRQNKQRQVAAREQAIADVFSANPQLDPTNPVDVRLVNQKLDAAISTERSTETGRGTSFIPTSAL